MNKIKTKLPNKQKDDKETRLEKLKQREAAALAKLNRKEKNCMLFSKKRMDLFSIRLKILRETHLKNGQKLKENNFSKVFDEYYSGSPEHGYSGKFKDKGIDDLTTFSYSALKKYESTTEKRNAQSIGLINFCTLADFYDVSPSYLLGEIDEETILEHSSAKSLKLSSKSLKFIERLPIEENKTLNFLLESFADNNLLAYLTKYLQFPNEIDINELRIDGIVLDKFTLDNGRDFSYHQPNLTLNDILWCNIIRLFTQMCYHEKGSSELVEKFRNSVINNKIPEFPFAEYHYEDDEIKPK